jgi:hypothetical protein
MPHQLFSPIAGQGLARAGAALAGLRQQVRHVAFAAGAQAHSQRNGEQYSPNPAHACLPSPDAIYDKSTPTARDAGSGPFSRQDGLAGRGKHDTGRFHGAAVLQAHQAFADRILPDRQAGAGAPPGLHRLAIGAGTIGDPGEELQG